MRTFKPIFLALITAIIISCDLPRDCPECFTPPQELNIVITDSLSGVDLIFSNRICPDSLKIYYRENEQKIILDHEIILDSVNLRAVLACYEISWTSPQGIKEYYMYLGNNDVDTLFLDIEKRTTDCCVYFEWIEFKINNNPITEYTGNYLYNYKKRDCQ